MIGKTVFGGLAIAGLLAVGGPLHTTVDAWSDPRSRNGPLACSGVPTSWTPTPESARKRQTNPCDPGFQRGEFEALRTEGRPIGGFSLGEPRPSGRVIMTSASVRIPHRLMVDRFGEPVQLPPVCTAPVIIRDHTTIWTEITCSWEGENRNRGLRVPAVLFLSSWWVDRIKGQDNIGFEHTIDSCHDLEEIRDDEATVFTCAIDRRPGPEPGSPVPGA